MNKNKTNSILSCFRESDSQSSACIHQAQHATLFHSKCFFLNITCSALCLNPQQCDSSTDGTIYKHQAKTLNGSHTVNFSDYAGRVVLFINVATY
uniref:Glutathione peroxidase n=1 Tax=Labrus bergylta TaxID=56723 RepID=A0A3Q3GRT3_9LABR